MNIASKISGLGRFFAMVGALGVAACGGGSGEVLTIPNGTLRVAVTDAPACGFDEVNITVERVRVHTSQNAEDSTSGWRDLVLTPPRKINLLDLTNGVLEELGQITLPAGQYTQVRLVLAPNSAGSLANSVVPTGASEQALDTPSATQSGIKLIHPFTVPEGRTADLLLDFDACQSIVRRGNGTFGLKPVIAVVPRVVAEIVGNVDPTIDGMRISAQVGGTVMRSTVPDAAGAFRLAFLNPAVASTVDVVFTAPGRTAAVISAVPIALQSSTRVSNASVPISLLFALTRTASGTVMPATALANVRATQAVGSVAKVEIANSNADDAGAYSLSLPVGPPLLAGYSTTLPLIFVPQLTTSGLYTLEASASGFMTQTAPVDVTVANATVDFTLPPAP